jgi:hypothetical protein
VTSEIAAFDAATNTIWVAGVVGVDVLNAGTGALVQHIDTSGFGSVNSVAIKNGGCRLRHRKRHADQSGHRPVLRHRHPRQYG